MSKPNKSAEFVERAKKVKLLLMDCDGVLTDGRLYYSAAGDELKTFHVHDGQGIKLWHRAGFQSGIITGRASKMLEVRVSELNINFLYQSSKNKILDISEIAKLSRVSFDEIAYIGDDLGDIEVLKSIGFPVLVANAVVIADLPNMHITNKSGGFGAVREVVDLLLKLKSE